jgi:hypothetical protein
MKAGANMGSKSRDGGVNPEKYAGHEPSCALQIRSVEGMIGE